ncbi:MAG: hypothetical protein RDA78_13315 [Roseibium sp.]|uniref:hypothetical protein n=1 Tax=Roseibium sp. TaxID=1936156 RepID=UPI003D9C0741
MAGIEFTQILVWVSCNFSGFSQLAAKSLGFKVPSDECACFDFSSPSRRSILLFDFAPDASALPRHSPRSTPRHDNFTTGWQKLTPKLVPADPIDSRDWTIVTQTEELYRAPFPFPLVDHQKFVEPYTPEACRVSFSVIVLAGNFKSA